MRSSRRFGFLIFFFVIASFFSHIILAFPRSPSQPATATQPRPTHTSLPSITPNYGPLLRRNGFDLGNGWHISIENYEIFIPLGYATNELLNFYHEIITSSRTEWYNGNPAVPQFKLALGALEVIFRSNGPIPWDWVSEFGEALVSAAFVISRAFSYPRPHGRTD